MFDINDNLVPVDVRQESYPIKSKSRSKTQGLVAKLLVEKYAHTPILEDFTIPGSRLSVDFFLPKKWIAIEIQGVQHQEHNSFFHGPKEHNKFAKQKVNDRQKAEWAETNGFKFVEIETTKEDEVKSIIENL